MPGTVTSARSTSSNWERTNQERNVEGGQGATTGRWGHVGLAMFRVWKDLKEPRSQAQAQGGGPCGVPTRTSAIGGRPVSSSILTRRGILSRTSSGGRGCELFMEKGGEKKGKRGGGKERIKDHFQYY